MFQGQALSELVVRPVTASEEARYQAQLAALHYLGELSRIGGMLWCVATWLEQWVAQMRVSAAALKCGVRDGWIGWDFRIRYRGLKLIANNRRLLILPEGSFPARNARPRAHRDPLHLSEHGAPRLRRSPPTSAKSSSSSAK